MGLNFDLIFIPNSKRFQVSGVRCQDGGAMELKPETLYETSSVYGKIKVGPTTLARHTQGV
jgi:hypothetical protein